jgi:primosomal protein N' (replication factor Y)
MYVKIAINIPTESHFTYSVPQALSGDAAIGKRALVPFGARKLTGYIIGFLSEPDVDDIRDILDILDSEPLFSSEDLAFYSWASSYYHYPLGKTLHDILPGGIDLKSDRLFKVAAGHKSPSNSLPEGQRKILDLLEAAPKGLSLKRLRSLLSSSPIRRDLAALLSANRVIAEEGLEQRKSGKKPKR